MKKNKIIIGTRGSALALIQSEQVKENLLKVHPGLEVELQVIHTRGDKILDTALSKIGDKGLFTKEIEQQLLAGHIDSAVHSLKDLPTKLPAGLYIAVITEREDPADVLVSKNGTKFAQLPAGAKVLSGSLRRRAQLLYRRPDLEVIDVRGNIHTRLRKFDEGDAAAVVMAAAALRRAGLTRRITERFEPMDFIPGCGQGALALEIRQADEETAELIGPLEDGAGRQTTTAERSLLAHLEGGCQVPIGAYAQRDGEQLQLKGMIADLEGKRVLTAQGRGRADQAERLGVEVAEKLLKMGGAGILDEVRACG